MAQIVCPILLVCNSGSHHKMSISLIFLTSVHQVDMKTGVKCQLSSGVLNRIQNFEKNLQLYLQNKLTFFSNNARTYLQPHYGNWVFGNV